MYTKHSDIVAGFCIPKIIKIMRHSQSEYRLISTHIRDLIVLNWLVSDYLDVT